MDFDKLKKQQEKLLKNLLSSLDDERMELAEDDNCDKCKKAKELFKETLDQRLEFSKALMLKGSNAEDAFKQTCHLYEMTLKLQVDLDS